MKKPIFIYPILTLIFIIATASVIHKRRASLLDNLMDKIAVLSIKNSSPPGRNIEMQIRIYQHPLLLTGTTVEGRTDEPWMDTYLRLQVPFLLTYDEYRELVTPECLEMTKYASKAHFEEDMEKCRDLTKTMGPMKFSVLSAVDLISSGDEFLIVTEWPGFHVISQAGLKNSEKAMTLLRKVDHKWKQESFDVMGKFGIDLIPWQSADELEALANCKEAVIIDGKLQPAKK